MYRWRHFIVPLTRKCGIMWKAAWLYNVDNIRQKDITIFFCSTVRPVSRSAFNEKTDPDPHQNRPYRRHLHFTIITTNIRHLFCTPIIILSIISFRTIITIVITTSNSCTAFLITTITSLTQLSSLSLSPLPIAVLLSLSPLSPDWRNYHHHRITTSNSCTAIRITTITSLT